MSYLKVGIAGFGIVGKRRFDVLNSIPSLQVVSICDKNLPEKTHPNITLHAHYKDLLKEDLDILFVCLTNDIAAEVTIAGLDAGLHVFCEKPPGRNVEDIERVISQHNKNLNLKLMYGFNHRYHHSVVEALKIIRSRKLGKIISLRGIYGKSKLVTFNQTDWRTKREVAGGGVLLDQGIHLADLMRLFAGDFTDIQSFISNSHWNYDVEDNAFAIMRTNTGIIGSLVSSATQWRHQFQLDVNLEYGSLILNGILSSSKSYGNETLTIVEVDPINTNGDPKEITIKYNEDPSWNNEVKYFIECICNDHPIECGSSSDALSTMKLVYGIYNADSAWKAYTS